MLTKVVCLVAALCTQSVYSSHYHGPTALPVVLHNGYLADTHDEVAAVKSAHLVTLSHQAQGGSHGYQGDSHYNQHGHQGDLRYHGPTATPHVLHDGHIADTHEVAAAKAEHYAAVSRARAHGGYNHGGDYDGQYASGYSGASGAHQSYGSHASYHGPTAIPHVLHDGHIADTHEVAAAKAEHHAAVSRARAHGGYNHGGEYNGQYASGYSGASWTNQEYNNHASYHGPTAIPHVLHDGHIADTHEVAAAKAEHYAAVSRARAHGGYSHGGDYNGQYASRHSGASGTYQSYGSHASYHGPTAIPHVLHDGHIADTHEVAAAKAEHHAAVSRALAHGGYNHGGDYNVQYASGYSGASGTHQGYGTHASYHGPLATPVVLPSGYLADTHDVAHAKRHHLHLIHSTSHH